MLTGSIEDLKNELGQTRVNPDELVENLAAFIYERCDNMLANTSEDKLRRCIYDLAERSLRLFLKANTRRRGLRCETPVIRSPDELLSQQRTLGELLSSGYELVVLPRVLGPVFFKEYYPAGDKKTKICRTIERISSITKLVLQVNALMRGGYREALRDIIKLLERIEDI
jgi:hypothetical protein